METNLVVHVILVTGGSLMLFFSILLFNYLRILKYNPKPIQECSFNCSVQIRDAIEKDKDHHSDLVFGIALHRTIDFFVATPIFNPTVILFMIGAWPFM